MLFACPCRFASFGIRPVVRRPGACYAGLAISDRISTARSCHIFIAASLLWLPVGITATAVVRGLRSSVEIGMWPMTALMMAGSLIVVAPCGLPLALACRRVWRLGYRRTAWTAMAVLAPVTILASLLAGLLGPVVIAVHGAVLSLPVWTAAAVLRRRR